MTNNIDKYTVQGFGDEWERFDQSALDAIEQQNLFDKYFSIFPWEKLPEDAVGFDMGCGSGRWAQLMAPKVGILHCIDPSSALAVAQKKLSKFNNCVFHLAGVGDHVLPKGSMDFGYSLGVLHHVPNTSAGISECAAMLKPGAPFLLYLYYAFDTKPLWFRWLWKCSDLARRVISKLPHGLRFWITQFIALSIYWPLARLAWLMERVGLNDEVIVSMPLSFYRNLSLYTMRTDALDRFGTRLEQRFTKLQIICMMKSAGFESIEFSDKTPYWCALGIKAY